jgi:xanthosine utilization system XapX-like protein
MSSDLLGLVGAIGVLIAVGIAVYWWQHWILRLIPFLYATAFSFVWFGETAESFVDLAMRALIVNSVTGFMLFFAWLQIRVPRPPAR